MNRLFRLKSRMNREGIVKTALYVFCALHYSMRESLLNLYLDLKYSGRLLTGNSRSSYRHLGANDVYHTVYPVMFLIFRLTWDAARGESSTSG